MSDTPTAPLGDLPEVAAQKHGDTPFLSDQPWTGYGRPVTDISGFARAVRDYADRFWAAGVRSHDVVAVVQRNHIEVQALAYGLSRIGALPVLLSFGIEPDEIPVCLSKLDTPYVVLDTGAVDRLSEQKQALAGLAKRLLYVTPGDGSAAATTDTSWLAPTGERAAHQAKPRGYDEWAVVTHTSGTTSVPKLAAQSGRTLYSLVATQIANSRKFGEVALSAKHLSFVHARSCSVVLAFLEVAMPILAISDPDPDRVRELMLAHKPDSIETHPNIFILWEPVAAHPSRPFAPVQRYVSTFDAIHPRTIRILFDGSDRPDAYYLQAYGQTESGAVTVRLIRRPEAATYRPRDVGHAVPGAAFRIVDAAGEPVPRGQAGMIESHTPGLFRGYLDTTPTTLGHWWPMGDAGREMEDGSLELLDRIVDQIEGTTSVLEIEDALLDRLPELIELVLLKSVGGEPMVAVASPREGARFDHERFRQAATEVGLAEIPVHVLPWNELPLTGSYKVRRGILRSRLEAASVGA